MDGILLAEALMRTGGAAILGFVALMFALSRRHGVKENAVIAVSVLGAISMLAGAFETVMPERPGLVAAMRIAGSLYTLAFWILALALFDYRFRFRWLYLLPGLPILLGWALPGEGLVAQAVRVILMGHVVIIALRDWEGELVDPCRRFRLAICTLVPFAVASSLVSNLAFDDSALAGLFNSVKLVAIALLFAA